MKIKEIAKEFLLLEIAETKATVSKEEFIEKMYMESEKFFTMLRR